MHAHATHHMAHHALAGFFIIGADVIMLHPLAHRGEDSIVGFLGNQAAIGVDDVVGGGGVAANLQLSFAVLRRRELHLVAIMPRVVGTQHRQGLHLEVPNATQSVLHLLALGNQLPSIAQML